jgi:hypothetical protein
MEDQVKWHVELASDSGGCKPKILMGDRKYSLGPEISDFVEYTVCLTPHQASRHHRPQGI